MLKSDKWIIDQSENNELISPFIPELISVAGDQANKKVSFGPSSYGYDVRLAPEFKVFTNANQGDNAGVIDPKNFDEKNFIYYEGDTVLVPPNSFVLGRTLEFFKTPRDITGLIMNKSTYARCGLNCLTTVMEAGFEGELVLEFANTTPLPIRLYANEGVAQLLFVQGDGDCMVSYADRSGKYQGQRGVTTPRML